MGKLFFPMKKILNGTQFLPLFLCCLLFSCHSQKAKEFGGIIKIGESHTPTEINPLTTDSSISANLLDLIFDTLVRPVGEGKVEPGLAERWEITPDHKAWTIFLRKDVFFHDGTPLKAEDVKFTYETLKESKGRLGYENFLTNIKEIHILDPYTLQIILSKPDNALWVALAFYGIVPKHLLEKDPQYKEFNRHPIGSGPYRFVSQDNQEVNLEANEHYFEGRPYLDKIIVKVLPSQRACLNNFIAGKIDMVFLLNPEDYGALSQIPSIKVYNNWYPMLYMAVFNMKNDFFKSPKMREALNLAVNRPMILDRVLQGKGMIAKGTTIPDSSEFEDENLLYSYDPQKALQLLKEEGWKDLNKDFILEKNGKSLEFTISIIAGDEVSSKILTLIQQQLQELGVKVNASILPLDEYIRHISREKDFDVALMNAVFLPLYDNNFIFFHSSQIETGINFSSYANPEADRLLEEARFSFDPEEKKKAFLDFQQVLHQDPPAIFLFWRQMPIALHERFKGVPETRMESLRDLVKVWVPKEERRAEE
jgi:peptide/nickel transport system substrate-binding protein